MGSGVYNLQPTLSMQSIRKITPPDFSYGGLERVSPLHRVTLLSSRSRSVLYVSYTVDASLISSSNRLCCEFSLGVLSLISKLLLLLHTLSKTTALSIICYHPQQRFNITIRLVLLFRTLSLSSLGLAGMRYANTHSYKRNTRSFSAPGARP